MNNLAILMHADWSTHPKKRIACYAVLQKNGRYLMLAPQPVGDLSILLPRIKDKIGKNTSALIGFDFPIGIPIRYAEFAGVERFLSLLPELGEGKWSEFYKVAERPDEISIKRPFYPLRPGVARQNHLLEALGVTDINELRRTCEKKTYTRRPACPLFWTLGPQQVGKAAITGWRDVLTPGLRNHSLNLSIWPFSGKLDDLLGNNRIIVVETYPAEYYTHFGIVFRKDTYGGKRSPSARSHFAPVIINWASRLNVDFEGSLQRQIHEGFSIDSFGDDAFDAFIGIMGMINIIYGNRSPGAPDSKIVRNTEGWIFGQSNL